MQIWQVTQIQKVKKNYKSFTNSYTHKKRETSHKFYPPVKQGFTRVKLFFLETKSLKMSFFLFFYMPLSSAFFFLSLSVVFPLDRASNGDWDLSNCWSQLKSLILFLNGTIPLKYKFSRRNLLFRLLSFFSDWVVETYFLRFLLSFLLVLTSNSLPEFWMQYKTLQVDLISFRLSSLLWIPFWNSERNTKSFKWI